MNSVEKENPKQIRHRAFRTAKEILDLRGNRLNLVVGILACILATVAVAMIASAFDLAFDLPSLLGESMTVIAVSLLQAVLSFFTVYPLYLGLFRVAMNMCRGEATEFSQLFVFYGSLRMLGRAWGIQLRILWNSFPLLLVVALPYLSLFEYSDLISKLLIPILASSESLLLFAGLCTSSRIFPFAMLAVDDLGMPLSEAAKQAKAAVKGSVFSVFAFRIRLMWRFLLSLLTVGVVTLFHVLPLTLLAYNEYSTELLNSKES